MALSGSQSERIVRKGDETKLKTKQNDSSTSSRRSNRKKLMCPDFVKKGKCSRDSCDYKHLPKTKWTAKSRQRYKKLGQAPQILALMKEEYAKLVKQGTHMDTSSESKSDSKNKNKNKRTSSSSNPGSPGKRTKTNDAVRPPKLCLQFAFGEKCRKEPGKFTHGTRQQNEELVKKIRATPC